MEIKYVAVLPYLSLNGAARTGPKPRPTRKSEKGRRATVCDTWKSFMTSATAEVYIEEANVLLPTCQPKGINVMLGVTHTTSPKTAGRMAW